MGNEKNIILVVILLAVAFVILYYLYKNGFPLPKPIENFFKFLDDLPNVINNFFGGVNKWFDDAQKNIDKFFKDTNEQINADLEKLKQKNLTIVNPIEADSLAGGGKSPPTSGITKPPEKKTTQTTTTKTTIETNLATGSPKVTSQHQTINLVESLTFSESAAYTVAAAKELNKKPAAIQKDVKQYQITAPNSLTVNQITQLGKIPNPVNPQKSILDLILGDLQTVFSGKPLIPVAVPTFPIPINPVAVIP